MESKNKLIAQFMKRYKNAQGIADLWVSIHQACYFYGIPNKNRFWRPKTLQGEIHGSRVYDTTAVEGVKTFVSKLHSAMTPPQTQWGYLSLNAQWKKENAELVDDAQNMLDDYTRKVFSYIHASNFDVVINECYFDLAVGTACLVVNSYNDDEPLLFTSIPMDKLNVEEAMTGRLESWYRNWENVKISEIKVRWHNAVIPAEFDSMMKADPDANIRTVYEGVMYMPREPKPYCYIVCTEQHLLVQEWHDLNPGITWRFQKINNDVYGRGPLMDALPSIISLNEMARLELAAANLNVFKPVMAFSDTVFQPFTFTMEPMSVIPIAPIGTDGQVPIIPFPDTSNPQFMQFSIQDLRLQINRLLFAESPIQTDSTQPASATELMIRQQELAQKIGPLFSRMQQEFLEPVMLRIMSILDKRGILPKPKFKNKDIQFVYTSPLALAKGQEQIGRFTQYMQLLQGMFGEEGAGAFVNPVQAALLIANYMQIDNRFLNTPDQVREALQNNFNQMQETQDAMMQNQQQASLPSPQ